MNHPRWLITATLVLIGSIASLSLFWVVRCTFYVGPPLLRAWEQGKLKSEPKVCADVDERAVATLTSLLATLLAWNATNNPPQP